ncbi:uncharacterized protein LOC128745962 [Sabethes cyaneus]|uniref:uncharacterized protein LOC128745962 n=1 Tax=Sabethes cyaneus TaxID=53552 RepID=UPI00237E93A1|nr:uncharacterized protein LOC128745962 [Sabethes cyaneus]
METLIPSVTAEYRCPVDYVISRCHQSRSVPVIGTGDEGFQLAFPGNNGSCSGIPCHRVSVPSAHLNCHPPCTPASEPNCGIVTASNVENNYLNDALPILEVDRTPGCTDSSTMEVPILPAAVAPFLPALISRPGPACGCSERGFQNSLPGKRTTANLDPPVDPSSVSSTSSNRLPNSTRDVQQNIHVYYQNVGGMNASVHDYLLACVDSPYDIIVLTETWLDERTSSTQIFGPNYEVFRCDRSAHNSRKSTGGGVLVAVHRQLKASVLEHNDWLPVEQVWVSINLSDRSLYLCAVYFPPDRVRDAVLLKAHMASVSTISSAASASDDLLILGDFNLPGINWRDRGNGYLFVDFSSVTPPPITTELFDCYSTATVQQINKITNENGRCLDLCFASVCSQAPECMLTPAPLVKDVLHHPPLLVPIYQHTPCKTTDSPSSVYYDFNCADFDAIQGILNSIDWNAALEENNVNAAALTFSHILNYIIDRHVPKKTIRIEPHMPWINATLRRLKSERKAALRRFSRYKTQYLRNHYQALNKRYKKLSRHCFRKYLNNVERRLKRNPQSFWKYVSAQRKDDGLPSAMFLGSDTATKLDMVCQLFSRKFSSVFVDERLSETEVSTALDSVPNLSDSLTNLSIDDSMIKQAALKLKNSTSSGPDGSASCPGTDVTSLYTNIPIEDAFVSMKDGTKLGNIPTSIKAAS